MPEFVNLLRSLGIDSQPWRAGTTTLFDIPARQTSWAGIDSLKLIPELLKHLCTNTGSDNVCVSKLTNTTFNIVVQISEATARHSAGISEHFVGARNLVGIQLSYRSSHRLAVSIPVLLKSLKIPSLNITLS